MSVVDAHQLRSLLVVRDGSESTPQFGMIKEQLQSADNNQGHHEHQAGQHPYRHAARQVEVKNFQVTGLQPAAVGAEGLQQGVLQKNADTERDENRTKNVAIQRTVENPTVQAITQQRHDRNDQHNRDEPEDT